MTNLVKTLLGLTLLTLLVALGTYISTGRPDTISAARKGDAMLWMRDEFNLTDAQCQLITEKHNAYRKQCAMHCEKIQSIRNSLKDLQSTPGHDAAPITALEAELKAWESECLHSVEGHLRDVASVMPEKEGKRYLKIVLSQLHSLDHSGPPDLHMNHD
ncbi:MAG: hypothetical protein SFY80_13270 [Verrucomicrobiota bacterium]|nr:hypothetical protein [Verrucomicrobiota bacterium]